MENPIYIFENCLKDLAQDSDLFASGLSRQLRNFIKAQPISKDSKKRLVKGSPTHP